MTKKSDYETELMEARARNGCSATDDDDDDMITFDTNNLVGVASLRVFT
jgi:hypothetical protein